MNSQSTPVIFRKWPDGQIIALFPYLPCASALDCASYMHVGQHSGADPQGVIASTKPAGPDEYAALARELTNRGYVMRVMKRLPRDAVAKRREALRIYDALENGF